MENKEAALSYLVKLFNESLHGKQDAPAPAPVSSGRAQGGYNVRLVEKIAAAANTRLHGPAPVPGITTEGLTQDEALKASATRALVDVLQEQKDDAELDAEIARLDRDIAHGHRNQAVKVKNMAKLPAGKKFWKFVNMADNNQAELQLYGEIMSERCWLDEDCGGIYADEFVQDLQALGNVSQITCRINSAGGDIFAAIAIYTQLKTHPARVVAIIDGLAASAATLIVMAADEIQMPIGAMQMIHDPMTCLCGIYNAEDLEKIGETLDTIKESIVSVYADRTGLGTSKVESLMSAETWMDVDEAIKLGFCDTKLGTAIQAEMKGHLFIINNVKHDLSKFKTQPKAKNTGKPDPNDTGKPDPDETDNPGTVDKGDGPACDDCDGARCKGCPCLDCDEDDCDDCNEDSHASKKLQQERAIIGGFIAESANKILSRGRI